MIPRAQITAWRASAPWATDAQVEQDLVICRALVEIFSVPVLNEGLAFRGGTALHKLHLLPAARYSEDIDLVQVRAAPIGSLLSELRAVLDPWLGRARTDRSAINATLIYRFDSETLPTTPLRLKIEINTREHVAFYGHEHRRFSVDSEWFMAATDLRTFCIDELLATKLRALYQRKKGRDLFDLALALDRTEAEPARIVEAFQRYMALEELSVTRAELEANLLDKLGDPAFTRDIAPLLAAGVTYDPQASGRHVLKTLTPLLPGEPWAGRRDSR